jgi:TonB-dependent starch-binding outer membrane protein SusC
MMMKKLYKQLSLTALSLLLCTSLAIAQERTVSGAVSDDTGQPVPGVNVLVKGTTNGTATDSDGKYSIEIAGNDAILVFSFIGYTTQELAVGSKTALDVQLAADVQTLSELVVTGYSEQRKRDITGAVAVVDAEALKNVKAANLGQMLGGRAAGVTTSSSGEPGSGTNIRIRGVSSFGSSDPLIILDGIQIEGDKSLNGLNPNDIESVQVLKDAGAASIYGARASAGVVIITTKQGKAGKVKVTYDGHIGTQRAVKGYNDFLIQDPLKYAEYQTKKNPSTLAFYGGDENNLEIPEYFFTPNDFNGDESLYFPYSATEPGYLISKSNASGTDWWDETFRKDAIITNHNIGISGGTEKSSFHASAEYFKQQGTMIHTGVERFSARLNSNFTAGRFKFGESLSFARITGNNQAGGNQNEQNTMSQILKLNSIVPVYDIGGLFAGAKAVGFSNGTSPVAQQTRAKNNTFLNNRLLGSLYGEFKFTEWLKARSVIGLDYSQNFFPTFNYAKWEVRETNSTTSYGETWQTGFNYTFTNMLEFNKTFGEHNLKGFAGIEANRRQFRQIGASMIGYKDFDVEHRYLNSALGAFNNLNGFESVQTLASIFGKIDYEYNDKYLVSATVRRDGSSNFIEDKYGVFPAVSVGWRISEESFMDNVEFLSDLKIRGGWGQMGNQKVTAYNTYNQFGARFPFDATYDIDGNGTLDPSDAGLSQTAIGNPQTTWETNTTKNIGFDASFLDGKITFVLDVYDKDVEDLLYQAPLPGTAGNAVPPFSNIAHMNNRGYDISLGYKGELTSDIGLVVDLNLSHYKNEILALDGDAAFVFPSGIDKRFGEINAWMVGQPITTFYGYQVEGIWQTQAEIDAADALGEAGAYQAGAAPGRFKWRDINNDGTITDDDKGPIGNPHPKLTMGLNLGLTYKAFDFNMFLFGSFGNKIFNYNKLFTHFGQFASNVSEEVLTDSWSTDNTGGSLPIIDGNDTYSVASSSFYVEDGSYVRASTISLGYTLPGVSKFGFERLRLYVQTQNLFTITKYKGIDPALSSVNIANNPNNNDGWAGYDFGNYPSSKSFIIGANLTF